MLLLLQGGQVSGATSLGNSGNVRWLIAEENRLHRAPPAGLILVPEESRLYRPTPNRLLPPGEDL